MLSASPAWLQGSCCRRHFPRQLRPKTRSWGAEASQPNQVLGRFPLSPIGQNWVTCPVPKQSLANRREPGSRLTPTEYTAPHPEHSWDSVGRKMVGVDIRLETNRTARVCWDFCFSASALFLTRDIILSKQVSHHALPTEA